MPRTILIFLRPNKQNDPTARTVGSSRQSSSVFEIGVEQRQRQTAIPVYTEMAARAKMRTSPPDCLRSLVG